MKLMFNICLHDVMALEGCIDEGSSGEINVFPILHISCQNTRGLQVFEDAPNYLTNNLPGIFLGETMLLPCRVFLTHKQN
jgi:hypothetical protein